MPTVARKMPELVFVSWIYEGIGAREMRNGDLYNRVAASNPVDFLHNGDHVFAMLDHVIGGNFSEGVISEGPRAAVQVMDDIRMNADIAIDIDGIRKVLIAAAQVEKGFRHWRAQIALCETKGNGSFGSD